MPCLIRQIPVSPGSTSPGAVPENPQPDRWVGNLAEATEHEREPGVYGVFATWHDRRVVCLSRHFDRLEDSAVRAGFTLELDRDFLRLQLNLLINDAGFSEARVRVSAASGSRILMLSAEPYDGPPVELRRTGIQCATISRIARSNPQAKVTSWLRRRSEIGSDGPDVDEHLLLDEARRILEGTRSNFYVIRRGGSPSGRAVLQTAEHGVLPGIARSIVLEVAEDVVDVDFSPPPLPERDEFVEAFLTSASRGIVPIVRIDGQPVGSGHPGEVTAALVEKYERRATELEEPL